MPYEVFRAADAFVVLGVANNSLWIKCCGALGRPELAQRPALRHRGQARAEPRDARRRSSTRSSARAPAAEWVKQFEAVGIPAGLIKSVAEVCESEHLKARGMIVTLPHPAARAR